VEEKTISENRNSRSFEVIGLQRIIDAIDLKKCG